MVNSFGIFTLVFLLLAGFAWLIRRAAVSQGSAVTEEVVEDAAVALSEYADAPIEGAREIVHHLRYYLARKGLTIYRVSLNTLINELAWRDWDARRSTFLLVGTSGSLVFASLVREDAGALFTSVFCILSTIWGLSGVLLLWDFVRSVQLGGFAALRETPRHVRDLLRPPKDLGEDPT